MSENISPEEKLLRLIRGQAKPQNQVDKGSAPVSKEKAAAQEYPRPFLAPKIIWAFFILSCIYLTASFIFPYAKLQKIEAGKAKGRGNALALAGPDILVKPYDFYAEALKNRRIFGAAPEQGAERVSGDSNTNLIKDFNLLGIISGERPQAIIENKKAQKTYYLNQGQFIDGFQVEDIREGRVILNYNGQKFDLYL